MQLVVVEGIDPGGVARAVDARTHARGVLLTQQRAVVRMGWDDADSALYTAVREGGATYEAAAYFDARRARLEFAFGECTCEVGGSCAHVVASVLVAAGAGEGRAGEERSAQAPPLWERTLRTLFAPRPPSLDDLRAPVPLAVELALSAGGGARWSWRPGSSGPAAPGGWQAG